jgi:hypothetical protein
MSNIGPEPRSDANTLALMHAFNQAVAEAESAIALTEHVKDPAVASLHARLKNCLTLVKHSMTQSGPMPS